MFLFVLEFQQEQNETLFCGFAKVVREEKRRAWTNTKFVCLGNYMLVHTEPMQNWTFERLWLANLVDVGLELLVLDGRSCHSFMKRRTCRPANAEKPYE